MVHTGGARVVYLHPEGVWRATGGEIIAHYLASGATFLAVRPLECAVKSPQRSPRERSVSDVIPSALSLLSTAGSRTPVATTSASWADC